MAVTKPGHKPEWASSGVNTTDPDGTKKRLGWENGEPPASSFMNWLQNNVYKWVLWFEQLTEQNEQGISDNTDLIESLTTDDIANASDVTGGDTTEALNSLEEAVNSNSSAISTIQIPIGGLMQYAGAPETLEGDWLPCDHQTHNKTTYPELYNVIKNKYNVGGEAADEFRVPPSAGMALIGTGTYIEDADGDGNSESYLYELGDVVGEVKHKLTEDELAAHTHASNFAAATDDQGASEGYVRAGDAPGGTTGTIWSNTINSTGGDTPHENRPPSLAVNVYIRAK